MNGNINSIVAAALASDRSREEKLKEVIAIAEAARARGYAKDYILADLQNLRMSVPDADEDIILELMDYLAGWCSPHARID